MGNQQHAGVFAGGVIEQHMPDVRLGDRVEHGGRLVADQVARARGQRAGDAEALQLAAGQLVGVALQPFVADTQIVK